MGRYFEQGISLFLQMVFLLLLLQETERIDFKHKRATWLLLNEDCTITDLQGIVDGAPFPHNEYSFDQHFVHSDSRE